MFEFFELILLLIHLFLLGIGLVVKKQRTIIFALFFILTVLAIFLISYQKIFLGMGIFILSLILTILLLFVENNHGHTKRNNGSNKIITGMFTFILLAFLAFGSLKMYYAVGSGVENNEDELMSLMINNYLNVYVLLMMLMACIPVLTCLLLDNKKVLNNDC